MKTTIILKTDKEVKEGAQKVARDLGLTLSAVINASLKQFVRSREAYFSLVPRMTPELERIIARAEEDLKKGRRISPLFSSARAMDEYLDAA